MYAVSDKYADAIRRGARTKTACNIYQHGNFIVQLGCVDGRIDIDPNATTRRTFELYFDDPVGKWIPGNAGDPLAPFGPEAQPLMGPVYSDGTWEAIPMGMFPLDTFKTDNDVSKFDLILDASDRSKDVASRGLRSALSFGAGSNGASVIKTLIQSALGPNFNQFHFNDTGLTIAAAHFDVGADPWAASQDIATSMGQELFFDRSGALVLRNIVDPSTLRAVWDYKADSVDYSEIEEILVNWTRDKVFNHIIVQGESSSNQTPIRADAMVLNPLSPFYVGDEAYGDHPTTIRSNLVTSFPQAQAMANSELVKSIRQAQQVEIKGIGNSALDETDVLSIERLNVKVGGNYTIIKQELQVKVDQQMDLLAGWIV